MACLYWKILHFRCFFGKNHSMTDVIDCTKVIYTYSAEVFPTTVRTIALGFGSLGGGLGNVIAPYILQLQVNQFQKHIELTMCHRNRQFPSDGFQQQFSLPAASSSHFFFCYYLKPREKICLRQWWKLKKSTTRSQRKAKMKIENNTSLLILHKSSLLC